LTGEDLAPPDTLATYELGRRVLSCRDPIAVTFTPLKSYHQFGTGTMPRCGHFAGSPSGLMRYWYVLIGGQVHTRLRSP
jgi:hypothetical protein